MNNAMIKLCGMHELEQAIVSPSDNTVNLNGKRYHTDMLSWEVPTSGMIYGTLLNYKGALAALGNAINEAPYNAPPKAPILYIKPVNTHIGYGIPIPLPDGIEEVSIGAALGVVIGRTATRVCESNALDYVAGYTIVNDVRVPHESVYRPAVSQLSRDGFCPVGPWIIQRDAISNPDQLGIRVLINGELSQENNTANLIRSISQLIADISDFMTLSSGDILLVGIPENAPLAKAGDRVRIEIDGIGSLENPIVPEQMLVVRGGAAQ
ncbi:4-hydroxyphenylacetate isomerase [Paenibacillus albiflavus]|uniref:4-hydroxyphenylacetate isomerase n=1 Tax=Paenibacillus albiflavus TaxID=2545760 RepID=A0A4R4ECR3_9BACL|nr:fumarylacetoacetate hydrolase family protein [Paenibacillus albiflavus]TCZ77746.1 4-hydroxyphenylacetate isomerase [Paenibacillus albiflavus]